MDIDLAQCYSELKRRELLPASTRCVFVAGSVVRGWGNVNSDLDIYVVSSEPWTGPRVETAPVSLDPKNVPVNAFYVEERRWDVEYWLSGQVDQMLAKLSPERYDREEPDSELSRHENDFVERVGHAQALTGLDSLETWRSAVDHSAVRRLLARERLYHADLFIEDAAGQLLSGDLHSAVLSGRLAFAYAVDALTASCGELGFSTKWRARRMMSIPQDVLAHEEYWRLETMQGFDPAAPDRWVEEVLQVCYRIAREVAV